MNRKKIIIEIITTHMIEIPSEWDENSIDFYLNDSAHCLENEFHEMLDHKEGFCDTCWRAEANYIRDATEEDVKRYSQKPGE